MEYTNGSAPYGDAYVEPAPAERKQEVDARSPGAESGARGESRDYPMNGGEDRRPSYEPRDRAPPPPRRPAHAPEKPTPSQTLGVFGLSVRTRERDLDYEFGRYGTVESVHIVYDQRSERSRGFGFIRMGSVDEAALCIEKLNGIDLNGRRIRVDFSVTSRPHDPTPGAYMGQKRPEYDLPRSDDRRDRGGDRGGDRYGSRYDDRRYDDRRGGGGYGGGGYHDRDSYDRYDRRDRDPYYSDRDYHDRDRSGRDRDYHPRDRGHERSPPRRRRDDYDDRERERRRSPSPARDRDPRASASRSAYEDPAVPTGAVDARY